jgi:hypothetical protein
MCVPIRRLREAHLPPALLRYNPKRNTVRYQPASIIMNTLSLPDVKCKNRKISSKKPERLNIHFLQRLLNHSAPHGYFRQKPTSMTTALITRPAETFQRTFGILPHATSYPMSLVGFSIVPRTAQLTVHLARSISDDGMRDSCAWEASAKLELEIELRVESEVRCSDPCRSARSEIGGIACTGRLGR